MSISNRLKVFYIPEEKFLALALGQARVRGLPDDAEITRVHTSYERCAFACFVQSREFPATVPGELVAELVVTFEQLATSV